MAGNKMISFTWFGVKSAGNICHRMFFRQAFDFGATLRHSLQGGIEPFRRHRLDSYIKHGQRIGRATDHRGHHR